MVSLLITLKQPSSDSARLIAPIRTYAILTHIFRSHIPPPLLTSLACVLSCSLTAPVWTGGGGASAAVAPSGGPVPRAPFATAPPAPPGPGTSIMGPTRAGRLMTKVGSGTPGPAAGRAAGEAADRCWESRGRPDGDGWG